MAARGMATSKMRASIVNVGDAAVVILDLAQ